MSENELTEEDVIRYLEECNESQDILGFCYIPEMVCSKILNLYQKEKEMYKNTGKIVKNKRDGKVGVVLREFETGQIQVLEKIGDKGGKVINTHDSWKTLEVIENE